LLVKDQKGQSKVQNLNLTMIVDHDVFRFQVTVNYAIGMSVSQHFCYLNGDLEFFRSAESVRRYLLESLTLDRFEDQNISVFGFHNAVNAADMGVFQFRKELGFPDQSGFGLFMETSLSANGFEGHFAFELLIVTDVDFSHPPFADEIDNAIMIDSFTEQGPFRVLFLGGFSVLICCRAVL
jgi:hypothetical protein